MNSKFVLVFAFVVLSIASIAAPASVAVVSATENVFKVHYNSSQIGTVRVSIINDRSQLVYTEVISNIASFVRPYNFSEMTEGEYTIVVEGNGVKQAEKVKYETAKVVSTAMVSEIENQKNKYLLNVTNNGTQRVTVRIYSNDGSLLHMQSMEVTEKASVIYDLNKVRTNDAAITFEISADGIDVQTIHI
jgi:hypothetical protein